MAKILMKYDILPEHALTTKSYASLFSGEFRQHFFNQ